MKKLLLLVLGVCFFKVTSQTNTVTCVDDGFENLQLGPLVSTAWIATRANFLSSSSCNTLQPNSAYISDSTAALVQLTPLTNTMVSGSVFLNVSTPVGNSPLGGSKVLYMDGSFGHPRPKLSKTFTVTPFNFVYRFAYKAYLDINGFCTAGLIAFKFYDCSGTLISALSKTIQPGNPSFINPDANYWAQLDVQGFMRYTPEWVSHSENLAAYIGSCVTVEVYVTSCPCGGAPSALYYDAVCSDKFLTGNTQDSTANYTDQKVVSTPSHLSCSGTATLGGLSGFSSYLWQGPAASSVAGATLSTVTTSVPGSYTLTATSGTNSFTQEVNLTLSNLADVSISGPTMACIGSPVSMQATGGSITNYQWSTGATTTSVVTTPTASILMGQQTYYVSASNTLRCVSTASLNIYIKPLPVSYIFSQYPYVCTGQNFNLSLSTTATSYTWGTGATTQSISITPTLTSGNYTITVAGTNSDNCSASTSITLEIFTTPAAQIIMSSTAICMGNTVSLNAMPDATSSYSWNTGSTALSILDSPTVSTVYSLHVAGTNGCVNSVSVAIGVNPLPHIQVVVPNTDICNGTSAVLSVSGNGNLTFLWSNGSTTPSISVNPISTTNYFVEATDIYNCFSQVGKVINVYECTGIENNALNLTGGFIIFPNPTSDSFTIKGYKAEKGQITNSIGQILRDFSLTAENGFSLQITDLAKGVYFVTHGSVSSKVIVK